jgi:hypothetical protein
VSLPAHLCKAMDATAGPAPRGARPAALGLARVLLALATATLATASAEEVREIDWRTSPLDLNLRGLNGEHFRFRCPPGKPAPGLVVGTRLYADSSAICATATHAGVLRPSVGGLVTIEICPGRSGYRGSDRHFVMSSAYGGPWGGSFIVSVAATDSCPVSAASTASHR